MNAPDAILRIGDLPSMPAAVAELISSMQQEDIELHTLAGKIALDQALAAKVLRLANSSFYGLQGKVANIRQAIGVLGIQCVRTLVTACAVISSFPAQPGLAFDFNAFWRHSLATAACARTLAPYLQQQPDTAFTAGLLHDIGTLAMVTLFPAEYAQAEAYRHDHDSVTCVAQRAVFGFDHALIGSALAARWKFPQAIQDAAAAHHVAGLSAPVDSSAKLALTVHLADMVAHALDLSGQEDDQAPPLSEQAWRAAWLSDNAWLDVFAKTELAFNDMSHILEH